MRRGPFIGLVALLTLWFLIFTLSDVLDRPRSRGGQADFLKFMAIGFWVVLIALVAWERKLRDRDWRPPPPAARHLCRRCGYDLRRTPDEGGELLDRCPECGADVIRPIV